MKKNAKPADSGASYYNVADGEISGHPRLRLAGEQAMGVYNLNIRNASLSDDGEYQCQVGPSQISRNKPIRANARLTVICESFFHFRRIMCALAGTRGTIAIHAANVIPLHSREACTLVCPLIENYLGSFFSTILDVSNSGELRV